MKGLDLAEFKRWWLQRPGREKLMLGACSLGVLLALGESLGITPAEKRLHLASIAEEKLRARWDQLQLRRKDQTTQYKDQRELENSLHQRLQAAQQRVSELNHQLADMAQLPDVLRAVVATMGSTRLLELSFADDTSASPASAAAAAGAPSTAASAAQAVVAAPRPAAAAGATPVTGLRRVYHLPVTLKVSGSWSELSGLLNQVEKRAPALQWQALSLDSNEWPAIQLTLRAHVRSLQPRWGAGP